MASFSKHFIFFFILWFSGKNLKQSYENLKDYLNAQILHLICDIQKVCGDLTCYLKY